jgi:hypothetical protein
MSWREFSHGTWHRVHTVHTYYAGTVDARPQERAQSRQSTRLSGMLILCMAAGTRPQQQLSATCRPIITSKDGHVMA